VTRPTLIVGGLATACLGTLLWCTWLIVRADLPVGAAIASWTLWAIAMAAAVTGVAYLREFLAHRLRSGARASARPLPALILLWVAGITAVGAFGFMLPNGSASAQTGRETGARSETTQATTTAPTTAGARTTSTTPSRSATRTTQPQVVTTSARQRTSSTPSSATSTSSTTTTSTPIRGTGKPTTPPGHK
jgi:hypothetical protein